MYPNDVIPHYIDTTGRLLVNDLTPTINPQRSTPVQDFAMLAEAQERIDRGEDALVESEVFKKAKAWDRYHLRHGIANIIDDGTTHVVISSEPKKGSFLFLRGITDT